MLHHLEAARAERKISCNEPLLLAYRSSQGRCFVVVLPVQKYAIGLPESSVCSCVISICLHIIISFLHLIVDLCMHLNIPYTDNCNNIVVQWKYIWNWKLVNQFVFDNFWKKLGKTELDFYFYLLDLKLHQIEFGRHSIQSRSSRWVLNHNDVDDDSNSRRPSDGQNLWSRAAPAL